MIGIQSQLLSGLFFAAVVLAQDDGDNSDSQGGGPTNPDAVKTAHAALSAVSWVFFFPLGSILIRLLRIRQSVWIHAGIQVFSTVLFTAGVGLGIQIALDTQQVNTYHAIIGLVVFAMVFIQAAKGVIHHILYRKHGRRTAVSHAHIWLGRLLITLGMINGGLGLLLAADATRGDYIAYGVIAAVIWLVWVGIDLWSTFRPAATPSQEVKQEKGVGP